MAASSSASSSLLSPVKTWRTAFLTLRDEALTRPTRTPLPSLLHNLIFSASSTLISGAGDLPLHEVTSDILFLMELVTTVPEGGEDMVSTYTQMCHLVHDICSFVSLEINLQAWILILEYFGRIVEFFLGKKCIQSSSTGNDAKVRPIMECLEIVRRIIGVYQGKCSQSENAELVKFLLHVVDWSHVDLVNSFQLSCSQRFTSGIEKRPSRYNTLYELHVVVFNMLDEAFSRGGSSFPAAIWHSTLEVLRKVMDMLGSKNPPLHDDVMCRFYGSLFHCLHVVINEPKSSISDHVSGFVATLRMFLNYGLCARSQMTGPPIVHKEKESRFIGLKLNPEGPKKTTQSPYRPPHLRRRETKAQDSPSSSDYESSMTDIVSSDSDYSDSDGSLRDDESIKSAKVRVAAIICIQDLCLADPKSFTAQWTTLLPTSDVLQRRKSGATLMTCLLFDPYLKARVAAASTLASMLDGPASAFLQVAEFKESSKHGSFTALSSSIGQILMQLHTGILYLIQHETNSKLLQSLFKILTLLIASTPYSRMHGELLPTVITSLRARIQEGFPFKSDQSGLMVAAISCLTGALSTSPSSQQVKKMFVEEISTGFVEAENSSHVLSTIFQLSGRLTNPIICFEALQALRAVSHNYPTIMHSCWEHISAIVFEILRAAAPEIHEGSWKGHAGNMVGFIGEKVITSAVKVLDECLRAISGFRGTEDLLDDRLLQAPFASDCVRTKKISSAPSYGPDTAEDAIGLSGSDEWSEAIEKHLPPVIRHNSAMVRTASVTCFAGITSSVFFSLTMVKQKFVISSVINAGERDEVPSVRSAACRAIGVIILFPQISTSAEIFEKFIHAVEINTRDALVSVRIAASWAWANICDSVRYCVDSSINSHPIQLLAECALQLTKDGDKIKSNAVRALGNLSRSAKCSSLDAHENLASYKVDSSSSFRQASLVDSRWLERIVQAFLSCVTTGNVKVQWNVCHALSNLFLNETLRLQDMEWAPSVFSVLLLLLRDSSNFKIRIQAAAALAVPESVLDYGNSFSDVIQGVEHVLENLGSDQNLAPSSFKYRVAFEKQLTSTLLHLLTLASTADNQSMIDFLVKKATFLEGWFTVLCSSVGISHSQLEAESSSIENRKKKMVSKALQSLIKVYEGRNHHATAKKFEKLNNGIQ